MTSDNKWIPLSVPNLKGNELKYVTKAVESEWVSTAGPYVSEFENNIAEYLHMPGAVACQSGTAGIHVALQLCNVRTGDLVIVPTLTFIAAVNPVRYLGADPIFMDCDDSLCIDPEKLAEFCRNKCEVRDNSLWHISSGRRIPALVVVHVFGNMADMESILSLSERYHFKVVEDATEAIGTKYTAGKFEGKFAGTMGVIGVYSFNGNKILTTGGGGMLVSSDPDLLKKAKHLTTQAKADEANFIHDEIGYNYRLTNLQAALGLAQLEQLEKFIEIKKRNYNLYNELIPVDSGFSVLKFREGIRSNYWFYSLLCKDQAEISPQAMIQKLKEHHIQSRPIWGLIHQQKPYEGSLAYRIEKAEYYWQRVVNLPCSSNLSEEDVREVVSVILK